MARTIATLAKAKLQKWWDLLSALLAAGATRVYLIGPPGTGKSTTAALINGKPTVRITLTPGTGVEDLLGMFHLRNGETVWIDGPAAVALRTGTRLVLDELPHMSPEINSLCFALLDDAPQITLPTGEVLRAAPGYEVIATSNDNPSNLTEAIRNRFEAILIANVPHPDAVKHLDKPEQEAISNYYKSRDSKMYRFMRATEVRDVRAFHMLKGQLGEENAALAVFGSAAAEALSVLASTSQE